MARLYTAAHVQRARMGPVYLIALVALVCLAAGYSMGTTSGLPWRMKTSKRTRRPPPTHVDEPVWQGKGYAPERSRCEDSCVGLTRNGVCDEGRATVDRPWNGQQPQQDPANAAMEVRCDLGTDCGDCGPWVHTNTEESMKWEPVKQIRAMPGNYSVFVRATLTPRPFYIAYTSPQLDVDVSAGIHTNALFELGFTWIWHSILSAECVHPTRAGERRLVADVGANFGYYSLLSASLGCRVVAWEPVPHFAAFFRYSLLRNNMTHAVQLRGTIVSNVTGDKLTIVVPQRGIWGTAGIGGANIDPSINNEGEYLNVTTTTERVDDVVKEDVLVMKADVEGFEPSVFFGAKHLLLERTVSHIFMEYSPGVAERHSDWRWAEDNPRMLMGLLRAGYTVLHLEYTFRDSHPDWSGAQQLPPMEEVTQDALAADIRDAWRLQNGSLGCSRHPELAEVQPAMIGCNALPEGLDPHSFRTTFGHNTNLWAFRKQPRLANIAGPATLAPAGYDVRHKYFIQGGQVGAGRRPCAHLTPEVQVQHRCPCTDKAVCGELEAEVARLAAKGELPPFPIEGREVEPEEMGIDSW